MSREQFLGYIVDDMQYSGWPYSCRGQNQECKHGWGFQEHGQGRYVADCRKASTYWTRKLDNQILIFIDLGCHKWWHHLLHTFSSLLIYHTILCQPEEIFLHLLVCLSGSPFWSNLEVCRSTACSAQRKGYNSSCWWVWHMAVWHGQSRTWLLSG